MPSHPFFLVDAFAARPFGGNQAAPINDETRQRLAAEFNLSETAFPEPRDGNWKTASRFGLRWFTPKVEVPLCGHATLATAQVLLNEVGNISSSITFETKSGELVVSRGSDGTIAMDFPQYEISSVEWPEVENAYSPVFSGIEVAPSYLMNVIRCLVPMEMNIEGVAYAPKAKKLVVVVDPATTRFELENIFQEFKKMVEHHPEGTFVRGVIVTLAPKDPRKQGFVDSEGKPVDYACRYFAPWVGIDEDPATGSAQCVLGPFWSALTGKSELRALQTYPGRGAEFLISIPNEQRIDICGKAFTVVSGNLHL